MTESKASRACQLALGMADEQISAIQLDVQQITTALPCFPCPTTAAAPGPAHNEGAAAATTLHEPAEAAGLVGVVFIIVILLCSSRAASLRLLCRLLRRRCRLRCCLLSGSGGGLLIRSWFFACTSRRSMSEFKLAGRECVSV